MNIDYTRSSDNATRLIALRGVPIVAKNNACYSSDISSYFCYGHNGMPTGPGFCEFAPVDAFLKVFGAKPEDCTANVVAHYDGTMLLDLADDIRVATRNGEGQKQCSRYNNRDIALVSISVTNKVTGRVHHIEVDRIHMNYSPVIASYDNNEHNVSVCALNFRFMVKDPAYCGSLLVTVWDVVYNTCKKYKSLNTGRK